MNENIFSNADVLVAKQISDDIKLVRTKANVSNNSNNCSVNTKLNDTKRKEKNHRHLWLSCNFIEIML